MKGPPHKRADPREGGKSSSATDFGRRAACAQRACPFFPYLQGRSLGRTLLLRTTDARAGTVALDHGVFERFGVGGVSQWADWPVAALPRCLVGQGDEARLGTVN